MKRTQAGFTLVEVVISLTILSLVVLVLYLSFSTAVDTWRRQGERSDAALRLVALKRLVADDFHDLRPYTANWEGGRVTFFAGGPSAVFYVTGNGLGSTRREGRLLFFSLLFVSREEDGGLGLRIYKRPVPSRELMEAVSDFATGSSLVREDYVPPDDILADSTLIVGGLDDALLSYEPRRARRSEGVDEMTEKPRSDAPDPLASSEWIRTLPGMIRLETRIAGEADYDRMTAAIGGETQ